MDKGRRYLDDLHDALFGNGNEPECNYNDMTIGYNEDGDVYYWLDVNRFGEPRCINVMITIENMHARVGSIVGDNWYESLDCFIEQRERLEEEVINKIERG